MVRAGCYEEDSGALVIVESLFLGMLLLWPDHVLLNRGLPIPPRPHHHQQKGLGPHSREGALACKPCPDPSEDFTGGSSKRFSLRHSTGRLESMSVLLPRISSDLEVLVGKFKCILSLIRG